MVKLDKNGKRRLGPSTDVNRRSIQKQTHLRTPRTIRVLKQRDERVRRDPKTGEITSGSVLTGEDKKRGQMSRVAPQRKWFGNTRVIGSKTLQSLREVMSEKTKDPYSIVLKESKLPYSVLETPPSSDTVQREMNFADTFGKKAQRKRPVLASENLEDMQAAAAAKLEKYNAPGSAAGTDGNVDPEAAYRKLFRKGQSSRIWSELYKVVDSSDVLLYVLDARDPMGTRSRFLEEYIKKEKRYKHLVFILNKTDLIPAWATARWLQILSKDRPTIAMHSSTTHPFGKGNLINLLRQFSRLHNVVNKPKISAKRVIRNAISVGIIGYPNAGKSSLINTLRHETVCKVAPIPGETKVWQYVMLTRSIYLIDCPGVVYDKEGNNDVQSVLKGIVRVERMGNTCKHDIVHAVLEILKEKDVSAKYGIERWSSVDDFLAQLARKQGRLLSGGVPDTDAAARVILYDWQRGGLPWFHAPPFESNQKYREAVRMSEAEHVKAIEAASALQIDGDQIVCGEPKNEEDEEKVDEKEKVTLQETKKETQEKSADADSDEEDERLWAALMQEA